MTREELIVICEKAFVIESNWSNRDSANAQMQLSHALALLKCGCKFRVITKENASNCEKLLGLDDKNTIWVSIYFKGFDYFEGYDDEKDCETFYLPTLKRIEEVNGKDWY